jgi:hypothetical protein
VAVGVAALRTQVTTFSAYTYDPLRSLYEETVVAAAGLVDQAEDDLVSEFSADLADAFGPSVDPLAVLALWSQIGAIDPIDEAIQVASTGLGVGIARNGRVLELRDPAAGPLIRSLCRVLRELEAHDPIVVKGRSGGERGLILWDSPNLYFVRSMPTPRGAHYVTSWPGLLADPFQPLPDPRSQWTSEVPPHVRDALQALGLSPDG